ncbi:hypothetical protein CC78DRAFT_576718 [Lojkania enalia]|uniref:Uncharacterized protein n=1 Tax=Lojkania enalia TaxID=147567 RepID=A0A9P4N6N5_9PLEO|nr:hypothetical protein CC78DRAFT_576718 [Didymosphaeria enalia]
MSTEYIQAATRDNDVFIGSWINWSQGKVAGATLTLGQKEGGFLIAFLALYVTFTGTCYWRVTAFIIHQLLCRKTAQDGMYHQRQALLRNTDGSASAFFKFLRMVLSWRSQNKKSLIQRIWAPVLLSFITMSAFAVASVFSSKVATLGFGETVDSWSFFNSYWTGRLSYSANYATQCYGNSTLPASCRTFPRANLLYSISRGIKCPFPGQGDICRNSSTAIRLDSGFINSHFDLGINAPQQERFLYRTVKECAPIKNEGYTRYLSNTTPPSVEFLFGPNPDVTAGAMPGREVSANRTFQVSADPITVRDYLIYSTIHYASEDAKPWSNEDAVDWQPIPELYVSKSDMSIFLLSSNKIMYIEEVNDPWFSANQTSGLYLSTSPGDRKPLYRADDPARAVVCLEKYQFCNPNLPENNSCTPLTGIRQAFSLGPGLYQDEGIQRRVEWSLAAIQYMATGFVEVSSYVKALLARNKLVVGVQGALPNNQWEMELENWFRLTLADLQRSIVDEAAMVKTPFTDEFMTPPPSEDAWKVCRSQKIRSDSYTSFNILGLTIILVLGGLIIILSVTLPPAIEWFQRRSNRYSSVEWINNHTLHLQRLAHEGIGVGTWSFNSQNYPCTLPGEKLVILDATIREHPVLRVDEKNLTPTETCHSPGTTTDKRASTAVAVEEINEISDNEISQSSTVSRSNTVNSNAHSLIEGSENASLMQKQESVSIPTSQQSLRFSTSFNEDVEAQVVVHETNSTPEETL